MRHAVDARFRPHPTRTRTAVRALIGQLQNLNRKANCMKRGVVSVERYLPNCVGS